MKTFAFLAGFGALALAGCKPSGSPPAPPAATAALPAGAVGSAPAWHLQDLAGQPVSSDQFKGKVVVLDFWATWCKPCTREIPGLVELQKKYADDGLVVICVALDEPGKSALKAPAVVQRYVTKYLVSYPIVLGDDKVQADFGGLDAIPTTFIINRDGVIRDKKVGALPAAQFERRILKVLKPAALAGT
jgi:thiol-disulfide isomerase/thioredoxin